MNISKRKTFLKKIFILCGAFIFVALWINYDMLRFAKQYIKNADDERLMGADCILVFRLIVYLRIMRGFPRTIAVTEREMFFVQKKS